MANLLQAPVIKYNGDKMKDNKHWGKAIRTHELETAIMNGLGERDMAMLKIMLFLTGNAEGFAVAEKTICDRCNISESGYKTARKKLIAMGWISSEKGALIVNFDNILKTKGYTENTSLGISENTSLGYTENTHNKISDNIINNKISSVIDQPAADRITLVAEMVRNSTGPKGEFKM